jgi:hypothetical protein
MLLLSSLHVGSDPLTNNTNSWRVSQIVDTPLKERNLVPGVTQYLRVAGRTQQSSNNTCFVTVVNGQLSPNTCGTLADETPSHLVAVDRPVLVTADAVNLHPPLLLSAAAAVSADSAMMGGATRPRMRCLPTSRDPLINTINTVLTFMPAIL